MVRAAEVDVTFRGTTTVPDAARDTNDALRRVGNQARRTGRAINSAFVTRGGAGGIRNAAFQFQDLAVQIGAGTAASVALSQQLPQLLSGFGTLGALLGVVVAVGIPLVRVMQNLKTEGKDMTRVFGTMQPLAQAVAAAFVTIKDVFMDVLELTINNLDRLISIGIAAAAFFSVRWVAAFVAARVATFSLVGALTALRGTLIRTGIGALIVGVGELIFQFTRLVQAAGGVGNAFSLLKDVAFESFDRIKLSFNLIPLAIKAGALGMKQFFLEAIADMLQRFQDFTWEVAQGLNNLFGTNLEGARIRSIGGTGEFPLGGAPMDVAIRNAMMDRAGVKGEMGDLTDQITAPMESVQKIRDLLASIKDDKITLPDLLGVGEDEEGGDKTEEKLTELEKRIKAFYDRIKALQGDSLSDSLGGWGAYFTRLGNLAGSGFEKLLSLGKAFTAAQSLMDAWAAYTATLRDPLLPWWARVAAAGQVLAAGIGAVNAIKGVTMGGGGARTNPAGGGGGNAGSIQGGPEEERGPNVSLTLIGDQGFSRAQIVQIAEALNESTGDGQSLVDIRGRR